MIQTEDIEYRGGDVTIKGFCARPDNAQAKTPLILVAHDWSGCGNFARQKAKDIAELGYIAFAMDIYGNGRTASSKNEKVEVMQPLLQDRSLLRERIFANLAAAKEIKGIDENKIAAIGFCFGGLCVLDLARSGEKIAGVVSFHGLLHPPHVNNYPIKAKILVLHGYNDPMVPMEQIETFTQEMDDAKADWQCHMYGNTYHAFMNPEANDPDFGTLYSDVAAKRAWAEMKLFFKELF